MSPVDFKKWPCRPVDFKGQGPQYCWRHIIVTSGCCYMHSNHSGVNPVMRAGHCINTIHVHVYMPYSCTNSLT